MPHGPIILHAILVILVLIAGNSATPDQVTATRLDGAAVAGRLRAWTDGHVLIRSAEQDERLATEQIVALRWGPAPAPHSSRGEESTLPLMELTDGSIVPLDGFEVVGTNATATIDVSQASEQQNTLSVPVQRVAAVRLQPLDAAVTKQWEEIRARDLASDLLVVLKRGGKSLDYVEGVVGDISTEKIEFKLDGEWVRVDRAKVAGVMFYRRERPADFEPRCVLHGRSGLRASAAKVQLAETAVEITTTGGVAIVWPLDDLHFADFSAGKIVYLSDLDPASQKWTPLVGLPADAALAAQYGQPRRDQSAYGGPLNVLFVDDGMATRRPKSFSKGLALRSRTELVYRLPAGFRQLVALAGIEPATSATGHVRLAIYGDDRALLEADIAGDQPPRKVKLDVAGIKRLKIVVDFGRNLDTGDWLNLCEARLVK